MSHRRLSICYAAPGLNLLPAAGPTRNVLSVADALSEWADVTVAFRHVAEPIPATKFRILSIDSNGRFCAEAKDDNATRGLHPLRHLAYCRTLQAFAARQANAYDVVLEKGWRLSGFLLEGFRRQGVPGVLIENDVRFWTQPLNDAPAVLKYALHSAAHCVARRCSQRASMVIAETHELKRLLVEHWRLAPEQIEVVGLGVDHSLFRPMEQQSARQSLGISPTATVLLYVGAMDEYHDLAPLIDALGFFRTASVELHVVGEGEDRARCEQKARAAQIQSRFHGYVAHSIVPRYIAAADLCLAPYRTSAFRNGLVPFSTLKVPEYMACGRPVATVPGGAVEKLVRDRVSGFLLPNERSSWLQFLRSMPSRAELASMGHAAMEAVQSLGWDKTARRYLDICERLIANERAP